MGAIFFKHYFLHGYLHCLSLDLDSVWTKNRFPILDKKIDRKWIIKD